MNDLSNKKVRDSVYDALGGEWKVVQIDNDDVFSLKVKSGDIEPKEAWITPDGEGEALVPAFFSEPVRVIPAQGECDFSGYQVGDEVYLEGGNSIFVTAVEGEYMSAGHYLRMPINGRNGHSRQVFFHAPPRMIPSNPEAFRIPAHIAERKKAVDWSQVPIDTLVVADTVSGTRLRYFAGLRDGRLTYWRFGATSLTVEDSDEWGVAYNMRLANEENTK